MCQNSSLYSSGYSYNIPKHYSLYLYDYQIPSEAKQIICIYFTTSLISEVALVPHFHPSYRVSAVCYKNRCSTLSGRNGKVSNIRLANSFTVTRVFPASTVVHFSATGSSVWPVSVYVRVSVRAWESVAAPMASCIEFHDVISVNDIVPMHNAQV